MPMPLPLMKQASGTHRLTASIATLCLLLLALSSGRNQAETEPVAQLPSSPILKIDIVDDQGEFLPARFSVVVDGESFQPSLLNRHGLRFVSIHESKKQVYPVTYSRGTGSVEFPIPADASEVEVHVARGFEFLPASQTVKIGDRKTSTVRIKMRRWAHLERDGWLAADAHLHYDRLAKSENADWITMLDADGLSHAFFMILKGGKVPGIWAKQYAYGPEGEAGDRRHRLVSGEEYRDSAMGHINLLGLREVIQPISTGGLGEPKVHVNWPPLLNVLKRSRELGGLSGVAHGGSLGRHPTAAADTVLGGVDFFEIGNAHLYATELWYRLLNCGYDLPPVAGTDLPNYPFRDAWQPFLGSMRTYVMTGGRRDFAAWKQAVQRGRVFVTSGPLLSFTVNGLDAGSTITLPAGGGFVTVDAELTSPLTLREFEILQSGRVLTTKPDVSRTGSVHSLKLRQKIRIDKSCWLAVRGRGVPIQSLKNSIKSKESWVETDAIAHSGVIRVLVDDQPIRSSADARTLTKLLRQQQEYYREKGRYQAGADRLAMLDLFENAIKELASRIE